MRESSFVILLLVLVFSVGSFMSGPSISAQTEAVDLSKGNAERGKEIYGRICVACHGDQAQGNKELNAPRLAGQEPWYVARQLKNFVLGVRGSDTRDIFGMQMRPMAMTLTDDQQIADIVAFLSTLEGC